MQKNKLFFKKNIFTSLFSIIAFLFTSILIILSFTTNLFIFMFLNIYFFIWFFSFFDMMINSYIVVLKINMLKRFSKNKVGMILLPCLIYFLNKDIYYQKFLKYNSYVNFLTLIYPFFLAGLFTAILTAPLFIFNVSKLKNIEENYIQQLLIGIGSSLTLLGSFLFNGIWMVSAVIILISLYSNWKLYNFLVNEKWYKKYWKVFWSFIYIPKHYISKDVL